MTLWAQACNTAPAPKGLTDTLLGMGPPAEKRLPDTGADSFRGRARAGTRAHYARARCMGWPIPGTVYTPS